MSDVNVSLGVDFSQATKALKDFKGQFEKSVGGIKPSLVNLAAGFTAINQGIGIVTKAFNGVTNVFGGFIDAAKAQEDALNQLRSAFIATGRDADSLVPSLSDFANELQKTTRFEDDLVLESAALIQTLGNLDEKGLKRATKAAADLSVGLGIDLRTAANLVGKAAAGNVEVFGRYGIEVKKGADNTESFNNALLALGKFSGFAERSVLTFSGAQEQLKNIIGDVGEEIGNLFIKNDSLIAVLGELKIIFQGLGDEILKNSDALKQLVAQGAVFLIDALKSLVSLVKFFSENLVEVTGAVGGLLGLFIALKVATISWTGALIALRTALITTGIGAVAVALGIIVAKLIEARNEAGSFGQAFLNIFGKIKSFFTGEEFIPVTAILDQGNRAGAGIADAIQDKLASKKFKTEVETKVTPVIDLKKVKEEFQAFLFGFLPPLKQVEEQVKQSLSKLNDFFKKGAIDQKQFEETKQLIIQDGKKKELAVITKAQKDQVEAVSSGAALVVREIKNAFTGKSIDFKGLALGIAGAFTSGKEGAQQLVTSFATTIGDAFFGLGDIFGQLIENLSAPTDEFVKKLTEGIRELPKIISNILNNIAPLILTLVKEIVPLISTILKEVLPDFIESFIGAIPDIVEAIIVAIPDLIVAIVEAIPILIVAIVKAIVNLIVLIVQLIGKLFEGIGNLFKNIFKGIGKLFSSDVIQGAKGFVNNILSGAANFIKRIIDGAGDFVKRLISGAGDFIKNLVDKIKDAVGGVFGGGGGGGGNTPPLISGIKKIFKFSEGGEVPGGAPFNDRVPALLTPGEVVLNRDQVAALTSAANNSGMISGGGQPQNLTIILKVSEQELSRAFIQLDRKGFRLA